MPHYVLLQRLTEQGRKGMRQTPSNIKRNIERLGSGQGTSVHNVFLTLGAYDIAAFVELASDEAALAMVASLAEQGNAESTMMRAFTLDEAEAAFGQGGGQD